MSPSLPQNIEDIRKRTASACCSALAGRPHKSAERCWTSTNHSSTCRFKSANAMSTYWSTDSRMCRHFSSHSRHTNSWTFSRADALNAVGDETARRSDARSPFSAAVVLVTPSACARTPASKSDSVLASGVADKAEMARRQAIRRAMSRSTSETLSNRSVPWLTLCPAARMTSSAAHARGYSDSTASISMLRTSCRISRATARTATPTSAESRRCSRPSSWSVVSATRSTAVGVTLDTLLRHFVCSLTGRLWTMVLAAALARSATQSR